VFNRDRLKPFVEPKYESQKNAQRPPTPDLIDEFEEYEVEAVIAERKRKGKKEYLVRWKGYSPENDTWEPLDNLTHAKDALETFLARGRAKGRGGHNVRIFGQVVESDRRYGTRDVSKDKEQGRRVVIAPQEQKQTTTPPRASQANATLTLSRTESDEDKNRSLAKPRPGLIALSRIVGPDCGVVSANQEKGTKATDTRTAGSSAEARHTHAKPNGDSTSAQKTSYLPFRREKTVSGADELASSGRHGEMTQDYETPDTDPYDSDDERMWDRGKPSTRQLWQCASAEEELSEEEGTERVEIRAALGKRRVDYGKITRALRHLLIVLSPHGMESTDGDRLTNEEVKTAAERLRGHGLSVYIV
jgi:hypothetical protein